MTSLRDLALKPLLDVRQGGLKLAAAALIATSALIFSSSAASAENRSLKLFFTHTGERATITFKRDGRFDPAGIAQVNRFLRDWRKNEPARMDPRLLDLVWEVYQRSGATDYIHIVSAYRSPATNNMLRGRSRTTGVAKNSQHMLAKAMDFYIPGVKLASLRALAMQMQVGGVGYYPTSGSPFVHLDVGSVRAWPRMSRQELVRIFPEGRTLHLPADGGPLPGYEIAMADYKRRVGPNSIRIADTADEDDEDVASTRNASLVTAMLPTPRSRAQEALVLQTSPQLVRAQQASQAPNPEIVIVPVPTLRPVIPASAATETASINPHSAMMVEAATPAPTLALREPSVSIASLPLPSDGVDHQEHGSTDKALVAWAVSAPRDLPGLSAPFMVRRSLAHPKMLAADIETAPTAPDSNAFDTERFWSDG